MKQYPTHFTFGKGAIRMALALFFFAQIFSLSAQNLTFPLNNGFSATVSGAGPTICQPSSANSYGNSVFNFYGNINPSLFNTFAPALWSNDEGTYHIAQAGVTKQIIIDIPNAGGLGTNHTLVYNYGQFDGDPNAAGFYSTATTLPPSGGSSFGTHRHTLNLNFPLGISKGYLAFLVKDPNWPAYICIIPFVVEGPTVHQVDSLGTTVQPQMPQLVLHAPPGDGSSSVFQKGMTTCRETVDTYAENSSNSANLAVKLGVAGSAGLFVTTKFEFSVTFSGGISAGDMVVKTEQNKTCVTVNENFTTTELTGPNGGGDVFIGYGTDLAYGVYPLIVADPNVCGSRLDTGLVFVPTGEPRKFAYTKTAILADIAALQSKVADSTNVGARTANEAQNQIDVWNQVLAMNDSNVNNPNNVLLGNLNFSAGVSSSQESSITVTESNSIKYEHFLEGKFGVSTVIEVGGSGVSGGYEFKSGRRYGATQNQSSQASKLVKYTLADNDSGDIFNLDVVLDPMFGTPAFRIKSGTQSSCPYQGGYQRDQPTLLFTNSQSSDSLELTGIPVGTSASFQLDLCNDSNEPREYTLKLNPGSNLNGAVVTAAGLPLNNAFGQSFTVPANSCLANPLVIEVKRQSETSPLEYSNLELFLEPSCEQTAGIASTLNASVTFTDNTNLQDLYGSSKALGLFPNPASNQVRVELNLLQSELTSFDMYDMKGQLLSSDQVQLPSGLVQHQLDVTSLPNGIYFVQVQSGSSRLSQKLLIQR